MTPLLLFWRFEKNEDHYGHAGGPGRAAFDKKLFEIVDRW